MFGALLSSEGFLNGRMNSFMAKSRSREAGLYNESPYDTLAKLKSQIELLEREGTAGIERKRRENLRNLQMPTVNGMPSDLLRDHKFDDWHEISDFPVFSTPGLARHLHFLVYNPWPFNVRTSVTVCGNAKSSLVELPRDDLPVYRHVDEM